MIVAQSLSSLFTDKLFIIMNKNDHKRIGQSFLVLKLASDIWSFSARFTPSNFCMKQALSTLSLKSFNLLITIILYLLLRGGGRVCGDFLCGGITWVLRGTEEYKGEDYRKVTPKNITEPYGEISWIFIVTQPRSFNPLHPPQAMK